MLAIINALYTHSSTQKFLKIKGEFISKPYKENSKSSAATQTHCIEDFTAANVISQPIDVFIINTWKKMCP